MKVALVTAYLGSAKQPRPYAEQELPKGFTLDVYRITDDDLPPRSSMHPRLQAKIPKFFSWQIVPGYDYYIWVDDSFEIPRKDSVAWLIKKLDFHCITFFKHPQRDFVGEELTYLQEEINKDNLYISSRYKGEDLNSDWSMKDRIYACGVFAYRPSFGIQDFMKEWFYQVCRYHVDDQISLPYVIKKSHLSVGIIEDTNILHNEYFKHCRHK